MSLPSNRRGFLRGLTTLPLIGGGVTLIGAPSAVAEPITSSLLDSYDAWLFYERRYLRFQRYARADADLGYDRRFVVMDTETGKRFDWLAVDNAGGAFHNQHPHPTDRAALVLSAVGCDWRRGDA